MGSASFYQILLIFALGVFMYLIYKRGNRKNKWVISFITSELESAINPSYKMYKDLGGTIGYKANYERQGYLNRVVSIFTTIPRQSLAVYPFHLLMGDHDKLQLNIYSKRDLLINFVIVKKSLSYKKLLKKCNVANLSEREVKYNNNSYIIFYKDDNSLNFCNYIFDEFNMSNILLITANPDSHLFHINMIPKKGSIEPFVKNFLSNAKKFLRK